MRPQGKKVNRGTKFQDSKNVSPPFDRRDRSQTTGYGRNFNPGKNAKAKREAQRSRESPGISGGKCDLIRRRWQLDRGQPHDSNGNYQFCGLVPDDYYIVVDKDTLPEDYIITTQNVGDDDRLIVI